MNKEDNFDKEEQIRYARHFSLPNLGTAGQVKLKKAKVLCIGAGGLGSPILLYLAAAGVGNIVIIDFDLVDLSNLQRQVLFTTNDVGQNKAIAAKRRLLSLNASIHIEAITERLDSNNALSYIKECDLVIDGSDNFPTRYLVNDACIIAEKPLIYGAISRFEGQVSVFNQLRKDGSRGPNYRDIFPNPPQPNEVLNCAEAGVLGVLPGIIGSLQANEAIKLITGIGENLDGKLAIFDALSFSWHTIKVKKNPTNAITELIDYEVFCGLDIPSIHFDELIKMSIPFRLIDVRTQEEYNQKNLGGELIPISVFAAQSDYLSKDCPIIVYCHSGKRGAQAAKILIENGYKDVFNLKDGVRNLTEGQIKLYKKTR